MSGLQGSSAGLDPRRRRLLFRSWHRGMREMDLMMGRFTEANVANLGDRDLGDFELLIEVPDRDVLAWLTGEAPIPENYDTPVFRMLKAFHTHAGPLHL